jgi:hypothetical protein
MDGDGTDCENTGGRALPEEAWWFGRRERIEPLVETICCAIRQGHPLSLIRLGDGEGVAMHHPTCGDNVLESCYWNWFGGQRLSQEELYQVRDGVRLACTSADILGLPSRFQYNLWERYGRVFAALKEWGLPERHQLLADSNLHWYLQFSGAMARILEGRAMIGVVGCRDIEALLKSTFNVGSVSWTLANFDADESREYA